MYTDYKITLNKALKNVQFPIPSFEDIFAKTMLAGVIFTTLDISEVYLHMPMEKTISTTKGEQGKPSNVWYQCGARFVAKLHFT